jgi:hypothetical protein
VRLGRRQACRSAQGVHASNETGLAAVDVAHASDDALIDQYVCDNPGRVAHRRGDLGNLPRTKSTGNGVGPEPTEDRFGRGHEHLAEGSLVDETKFAATYETPTHVCMCGNARHGPGRDPFESPRHPQMNEPHIALTVVAQHQVLAVALDSIDPPRRCAPLNLERRGPPHGPRAGNPTLLHLIADNTQSDVPSNSFDFR